MAYIIKNITDERALDAALGFAGRIFGDMPGVEEAGYSREKWLCRMKNHGDLMIYAESGGEVVGIAFGRTEDGGAVTVGPVAVGERFRRSGIAREMMLLLEKRALGHGIHRLVLGSAESAEDFYRKLGYTGMLLIQSEKQSIDDLLSLNGKYKVINARVYGGTINQVFLELPLPDRELQRKYENTFEGCHTQTVFSKTI